VIQWGDPPLTVLENKKKKKLHRRPRKDSHKQLLLNEDRDRGGAAQERGGCQSAVTGKQKLGRERGTHSLTKSLFLVVMGRRRGEGWATRVKKKGNLRGQKNLQEEKNRKSMPMSSVHSEIGMKKTWPD